VKITQGIAPTGRLYSDFW